MGNTFCKQVNLSRKTDKRQLSIILLIRFLRYSLGKHADGFIGIFEKRVKMLFQSMTTHAAPTTPFPRLIRCKQILPRPSPSEIGLPLF